MLYALCAALSLALLGLDQWVKHYVTVNIPLGEAQPFLPGLVELRTVHNYGAAWSSFSGMRWLLVAVTSVIVIAVAVVLLRRIVRHPLGVAAGFLILSGGVGNIIDPPLRRRSPTSAPSPPPSSPVPAPTPPSVSSCSAWAPRCGSGTWAALSSGAVCC